MGCRKLQGVACVMVVVHASLYGCGVRTSADEDAYGASMVVRTDDAPAGPTVHDLGPDVTFDGVFFLRYRYVVPPGAAEGEVEVIPPEYFVERSSAPFDVATLPTLDAWNPVDTLTIDVVCDADGVTRLVSRGAPEGIDSGTVMVRDDRRGCVTVRAAGIRDEDGVKALVGGHFDEAGPTAMHLEFSELAERPLANRLRMTVEDPAHTIHLHIESNGTWTFSSGVARTR